MSAQPHFDSKTNGTTVTDAFPDSVRCKTFIVTGVSPNGLGQSTAEALAEQEPACLILTGRSPQKTQVVIDVLAPKHPKTKFRLLQLDLSSIKQTRSAAEEILEASDIPVIDGVICNAGIMSIPERELSPDGIEMQLATNHIGHFLFVNLIMPKVIAAAQAPSSAPGSTRIVVLTSLAFYNSPMRFSDHNFTKAREDLPEDEQASIAMMDRFGLPSHGIYNKYIAYGQSKTANCLYSVGLNQRLQAHGVRSYAVHPGVIYTELLRHSDQTFLDGMASAVSNNALEVKTKEQGCATTLIAALNPNLGSPSTTGDRVFLSDCQIADPAPWAKDVEASNKLWALSEQLVGQEFSW